MKYDFQEIFQKYNFQVKLYYINVLITILEEI